MRVSGQLRIVATIPGKALQYPLKRRLSGPPELVWTFWGREKSHSPAGIRISDHPASSLAFTANSNLIKVIWLEKQKFITNVENQVLKVCDNLFCCYWMTFSSGGWGKMLHARCCLQHWETMLTCVIAVSTGSE